MFLLYYSTCLSNLNENKMFSSKNHTILSQLVRFTSSFPEFVNRNPRNLEKLRIARKPDGYHLEKPGRKYWHKYVVNLFNFYLLCIEVNIDTFRQISRSLCKNYRLNILIISIYY